MNKYQESKLTRLKAYLTERLEECNHATDQWYTHDSAPDYVYRNGFILCDCRSTPADKNQQAANAIFIATSRTLAPITYANTLKEIEWLEGGIENGDLEESRSCERRILDILESFKTVLENPTR